MVRRSTSFQLGDVITGEPHLYVANPPSPSTNSAFETEQVSAPADSNRLRRFVGAIRRTFSLGPTPENALAAGLDRVFMA